jgi:hypothetical protein
MEEYIYPAECAPEKWGWRYGSSFGHHLVNANDDVGRRIVVGNEVLEFQSAMERCGAMGEDCGAVGCSSATVVASSAAINASTPVASAPPVKIKFSAALLGAGLSEKDILGSYKDEIEAVLPAKLNTLSVVATGYHTTAYPYPGMSDPFIEQRGLKIGVVTKQYLSPDNPEPIEVGVEPLLAEFQPPQPAKCGTWEAGMNKVFFDVKGQPAMYVQTPATGVAKAMAALYVCRQTVAVSIETHSYRTKEDLTAVVDYLPLDRMEQLIGAGP